MAERLTCAPAPSRGSRSPCESTRAGSSSCRAWSASNRTVARRIRSRRSSFEEEIDRVFVALRTAVERGGARLSDVAKLTVFIVGLTDERLAAYRRVRDRHLDAGSLPASSVVGAASLFSPLVRIEIEAIAAV